MNRNFYTEIICRGPRFHSPERIDDLQLLEPNVRRKVLSIIEEAKAHGLSLRAFETYRSRERQAQLFRQGVTRLRSVGVHHYGLACDLVRLVNGQPSWEGDFSLLGHLARAHGLVWGGEWKSFPDPVHVQWCRLSDQPRLFQGDWYPDASYCARG